jgi:hypothetical protein
VAHVRAARIAQASAFDPCIREVNPTPLDHAGGTDASADDRDQKAHPQLGIGPVDERCYPRGFLRFSNRFEGVGGDGSQDLQPRGAPALGDVSKRT